MWHWQPKTIVRIGVLGHSPTRHQKLILTLILILLLNSTQSGPPRGGYRRYTVRGPMTRREAHENIMARYCIIYHHCAESAVKWCDLYRGLFNLSAALHAIVNIELNIVTCPTYPDTFHTRKCCCTVLYKLRSLLSHCPFSVAARALAWNYFADYLHDPVLEIFDTFRRQLDILVFTLLGTTYGAH